MLQKWGELARIDNAKVVPERAQPVMNTGRGSRCELTAHTWANPVVVTLVEARI